MEMNRFGLEQPVCKNDPNLTQPLQSCHVCTEILKIKDSKKNVVLSEHLQLNYRKRQILNIHRKTVKK